ncbi:hypothetical protein DSOUD_2769 [Desulfuromonas soudanensis]|uniref:Alpha/beta hydrolase n=1 Tax=Desulfuromonas soudanensis TaxID=1603606 RepID=A0A0M4DJY6_9BACT|nr:hypothetical protein DSOUD_2769 [Desulfuromonas soudanensis]
MPVVAGEIFAGPGDPVKIDKRFGEGNKNIVNNPAGSLMATIVDQYGNPVSNVPVSFAVLPALSLNPEWPLPAGYRNIELYQDDNCKLDYPIYGDCTTESSMTVLAGHIGAIVNTILGNTVNTQYKVQVSVPNLPNEEFTLSTYGSMEPDAYIPPQVFSSRLVTVTQKGESINAAKAGEALNAPLGAALFMLYADYTMEGPSQCTEEGATFDCWTIKGTGLSHTRRIDDGTSTMTFTTIQGGGVAGETENLGEGKYQASFTTGAQAALNVIEAVGEATMTVPEVYFDSLTLDSIRTGYRSDTLPTRTVTVKTGQKALFDKETGEILGNIPQKISYNVYGVEVPTEISPPVVSLGEGGMARENVVVTYTIQPEGASPAGYIASSAHIDLFSVDSTGEESWEDFLVGNVATGRGTAQWTKGKVFDPKKKYFVQTVLNRGSDAEIRGERVPLPTLLADLDIDSDNNAGWQPDGIHNLPKRDTLEDQVEDQVGRPGKVLKANLVDTDGDKVPGYADGIDRNGQEGDGASEPFCPLVFELGGSVFDPAKATVSFQYSGSNPAGVEKVVSADETVSYTLAPGAFRLWIKDGQFSRKVADIAQGGDYVVPDKAYPLSWFEPVAGADAWTLFVEGVRGVTGAEEKKITLTVDPDGEGPLAAVEGDLVLVTSIFAGLVPDYNHNRVIDEEDRARAAQGDIYYFWINDDDDEGETEGDDIPLSAVSSQESRRDCDNFRIDGVRDLIDFFPVALDIKTLLGIFQPNVYEYRLKAATENLNVVFPELTTETVENYLVDVETARTVALKQTFPVPQDKWPISGAYNIAARQGLSTMLATASTQDTPSVVLLEGVKSGQASLVLEVFDPSGNKVFSNSLNLSLDGVEQMFRHKNLIKPLEDYYSKSEAGFPGENSFPNDGMADRVNSADEGVTNRKHFEGFDAETDENNFVHVHGYNVNGQAARGEQSEAFKRLYWSGSRARFWGVSWYGCESQVPILNFSPNYHVNVRHALNSGRLLKDFVAANNLGSATVFAHSLGNMVVSSAIEEGMSVARYLMVNAAVAEEAFTPQEAYDGGAAYESSAPWRSATKEQMYHPAWRYPGGVVVPFENAYQPQLWASEWYKLFAPDDDRSTLTWRNRFAKVRDLTDTFVYYAPTDEVFRPFLYTVEMAANDSAYQPNAADWPGWEEIAKNALNRSNTVGAYAWSLQELVKGRMGLGDEDSDSGGWGFNLMDDDYWRYSDPVNQKKLPISSSAANAIQKDQLKARPFFLMNPDFDYLYKDPPVLVSAPLREELLANEIPALTFAAGHRGVEKIKVKGSDRDIDIRQTFAVGKPWLVDRPRNEWRHSDIYVIAYTYLSGLYDEWVKKIQGAP